MSIQALTLKQSMSKSIQAIMPQEEDKILFKKNIMQYIESLRYNNNESEEFQKNLLKDFLKQCLPKQFINTNKRTDLAIYNGPSSESKVGVIFEVKSLSNKFEMMSKEKLNSKGFQEIIHYYLNERLIHNNLEIKKCVITNGLEWFIIESKEIERFFIKNNIFVDLYSKWRLAQLSSQSTEFLYKEVISPVVDTAINNGIKIAHFDLRNALKVGNELEIKVNNLTQLYRFFTPENLLNKEIFTDSNKLNKGFYDELLYLMGLEEIKVEKKKVIQRLPEEKRQIGSFVENIIDRLQIDDIPEEKHYDIAVQLSVVWINRILFLKLLESQLVAFNGEEKYKFLTNEMLPTFDDIYYLFFGVLAKKNNQRSKEMKNKFPDVPYLNSSLFEETDLETSKIGIDRLREHKINLYSRTVIKSDNNKRKIGEENFLTYLFEFLDSYDFSTTIKHNKNDKNTLINASVLGLIFEKINGYKDGSFYTPGKITMYMSKNIVRKAVVQKINEVKNWNCRNIYDIQYKIDNLEVAKEVSQIIDTIKICDPAVGSGHFLVSVLNEIVSIKSELKVLIDVEGRSMSDIRCTVINDELVIQDLNGDNFIYRRGNRNSEIIQKTIFFEKRKIIENCLFGVDINPNSVSICRLRLWIELLKNSYYYYDEESNTQELITLPNIDINIKVGNSLLHKFDIKNKLDKRFLDFKIYLNLVSEYKATNDKRKKKEIIKQIVEIKEKFLNIIETPELKRKNSILQELNKVGQFNLFASKKDQKIQRLEYRKVEKRLKIAEIELEKSRQNPLFKAGLEWRMEFPEVLDEKGNFEGFDVIIANPPYIYSSDDNFSNSEKKYFENEYPLNNYQANTFGLFLELSFKLLRKNGYCSMIIPNTFLTIGQYKEIRNDIIENMGEVFILNSFDKIFEDASVDNCIINFQLSGSDLITLAELKGNEIKVVNKLPSNEFLKSDVINMSAFTEDGMSNVLNIIKNIEINSLPIHENYGSVKDGLKAYERGKGVPAQPLEKEQFEIFKNSRTYFSNKREDEKYRKFLEGTNIQRYKINWGDTFLKYGKNLAAKRDSKIFEGDRILIRRIPKKSTYALMAVLTDDEYVHEQSIETIGNLKVSSAFLLGVLNSKVESYFALHKYEFLQRKTFPQMRLYQIKQFPVPNATLKEQNQISDLVNKQLELYALSDPTKEDEEKMNLLNLEIDEQVLHLYKLSESEKEIIRNFTIN